MGRKLAVLLPGVGQHSDMRQAPRRAYAPPITPAHHLQTRNAKLRSALPAPPPALLTPPARRLPPPPLQACHRGC